MYPNPEYIILITGIKQVLGSEGTGTILMTLPSSQNYPFLTFDRLFDMFLNQPDTTEGSCHG